MLRGNIIKKIRGVSFFETVETPLANEIALPADIDHIQAPPAWGNITNFQELIEAMEKLPVVVSGSAYGKMAGQWYSVIFPRRVENPHVVCTAMARAGSFITSEIPRVSMPSLKEIPKEAREEIPDIKLTWPSKDTMSSETRAKLEEGCIKMIKERIGEWLAPPFLSTGTFCKGIANASFGEWLSDFWDTYIKIKFEDLKYGITDTIDLVYKKLWNQTDKATSTLQDNIAILYNSTNSQVDQIRDRINNVLKDLYKMWGVPSGYILTPVHIRNITPTGFEFQSYGETTVQFVAVGTGGG
jgi:hypothetical protein